MPALCSDDTPPAVSATDKKKGEGANGDADGEEGGGEDGSDGSDGSDDSSDESGGAGGDGQGWPGIPESVWVVGGDPRPGGWGRSVHSPSQAFPDSPGDGAKGAGSKSKSKKKKKKGFRAKVRELGRKVKHGLHLGSKDDESPKKGGLSLDKKADKKSEKAEKKGS